MSIKAGDRARVLSSIGSDFMMGDIKVIDKVLGDWVYLEGTSTRVYLSEAEAYLKVLPVREKLNQEISKDIPDDTATGEGGLRFNVGKPNPLFIPKIAHEIEEQAWEVGAAKYGWYNWEKGMKWSIPLGCLRRHARALSDGEWLDPETGVSHVALIRCNATMLAYYYYYDVGENDIPKRDLRKRALPIIADTVERLLEEYKNKRSKGDYPRMDTEPTI